MFRYRRRVEFAETDAAGIVHFSMFFRYMEEAEHALWRAAGLSIWKPGEDLSWPRISATFDYKAPLKFEDEFEVQTGIGTVSRRTIQWVHALKRDDILLGQGSITVVCARKNADGKIAAAEIPSEILSKLRASLA